MSLLHPELDIEARVPIWDSMQMIYMDTDPQSELEGIAIVCAIRLMSWVRYYLMKLGQRLSSIWVFFQHLSGVGLKHNG